MSIFRETFPKFIRDELKRRQDGMAARTPAFLQQLNTRNAWVRMTSGVNTANASGTYNNDLASNYVLQGGTLLNNTSLRTGLGGSGTSTYDTSSPGGIKHRLGIRPMPGITNVSIQSKGAYGSLQEATVSFNCWDIKQLEDLELLYMRPGYTVLLEFGWDFAKNVNGTLPKYDILNKVNVSLNDAFAEIYDKIEQSNGTYDALLGYVKNYNWSARDDGGYDCTTTIISLGEVLESLKCNWVPLETKAFDISGAGLLGLNLPAKNPAIINSYEQGIIPGLLHEMWEYLRRYNNATGNFSAELIDPKKGTKYQLCMSETMQGPDKFNRGGLPKPLGTVEGGIEGWITLGSFCDLLNNYVLLKDQNNNPLTQITTYETDTRGNRIGDSSLKCIASPLAISTNLGVCLVRNDNWASLGIKKEEEEKTADNQSTSPLPETSAKQDIKNALDTRLFTSKVEGTTISAGIRNRFVSKIDSPAITFIPGSILPVKVYKYNGNLQADLEQVAKELVSSIVDVTLIKDPDQGLVYNFKFLNGKSFKLSNNENKVPTINLFDYFYKKDISGNQLNTIDKQVEELYNNLFRADYLVNGFDEDPFTEGISGLIDNTRKTPWKKTDALLLIKNVFSNYKLANNPDLLSKLQSTNPQVATEVAAQAVDTLITNNTLQFLVPETSLKNKTLGNISNIYVNINYLYSQAISKNVASNDNQNTNNISIREYLQGVLRDIQNSLGNINQFDIQVDERNSIGRIIDLNFTGDPNQELFTLQIHNTNSVVRKYGFQSKIFPEMGSIIAISAQDPSGIGKLGYDNATLIAWNDGIKDRLIPKKTFTSDILISDDVDPVSFILPFLTKLYDYFEAIKGQDKANVNLAFGGLDFAYRDFLSNLSRFDLRNNFKTIIPTELNITLDGIGGMVIGNLFKINQDIVPKGYRNVPGRSLAYIVTKLGHSISDNDWVTDLGAYPVVFENATGTNVANKWNNQKYPGDVSITIGGESIAVFSRKGTKGFNQSAIKTAMNFFIGKGFSVEAAAALVGSFLQESQLDPTIININAQLAYNDKFQTYAAGIAQFVGPRRVELLKFAKSKGINIPNYDAAVKIKNSATKTPQSGAIIKSAFQNMTLDVQLNFVIKEISNYKGNKEFKKSTDLSSNILWVYEIYEGGNYTKGADIGNRGPWAADLVKRYNAGEFK